MVCPECNGKLRVIDMVRDTQDVYRRRKCTVCNRLIYTLESEVEPSAEYRNNWAICVHNSRTKNKEDISNG